MSQHDYVSRGKAPKKNTKPKGKASHRNGGAKRNSPEKKSVLIWWRVAVVVCLLSAFAYLLWLIKDNAPPPDNTLSPVVNALDEDGLPELPKEEWEYIKTLPGYEVEVDVEANTGPDKRYLMQCASFRTRAQAEEMKAKIAFQGLEAQIRRSEGNNGNWFKVILGPYESKRQAERERHTLRKVNITTCQIWFWNL